MSGLESVEELIALVQLNRDIAHHAEGCTPEMMAMAEAQLALQFPPSYRRFVAEFGACDIAGEEFLGVYSTPAMVQKFLGSVRETIDARERWGLPNSMLVIMFDGMGGLVVLDAALRDSRGESPVFAWTPGVGTPGEVEELAKDFGSYALDICERAVRRWRESP